MNEPYAAQVPPTTPLYVPPEAGDTQAPIPVNQYGSPVMAPQGNVMPNTIIVNQQVPAVVVAPNFFKTTPVAITCNFCKQPINTVVTEEFNFCACLLCWCTGLLWYVIIQAIRGKDICCYDAKHLCPNCGALLGTYQAC